MCNIMETIERNGIAQGKAAATLDFVKNLLRTGKMTREEIAASANTTVDEVIRIAKENGLAY